MAIFTGTEQSTAVFDNWKSEGISDAPLNDPLEQQGHAASERASQTEEFDPGVYFDRWLDDVQAGPKKLSPETQGQEEEENSQFFMESLPGSNSEVTFEGVLHFNGCSIGNIRSPEGTLVLTRRGRIEADIDVGIAVINGSVIGNITAAKRVVLDSNARVTGQIVTPMLSVRLGAVFDGDCAFTAFTSPLCSPEVDNPVAEQPEEPKQMAAGVR